MKHFVLGAVVAASLAVASSAVAAQASDNPPAGKTESIQVGRALALRQALILATGLHDKIAGQGGSQTVAHVLYEIDPTARWALNDDINALNSVLGGFDKTVEQIRSKMIADNGGISIPDKAEDQMPAQKLLLQRSNEELQKASNETRDFPVLFHVKRGDFKEPMPGELMTPMQQQGIIDP